MKKKTVYCLRIRTIDSEPWSEPTYYKLRSRRECEYVELVEEAQKALALSEKEEGE